jgi:magnesium transporter
MSECRYFHVRPGRGLRPLESLQDVLACRPDGGYVWIDLLDPTAEDLDALAGPLGLHPVALDDCLDEQQVPKVDNYPGHTFLLLNRFTYADREVRVEEMDFLLGKDFLVTVSGHGRGAGGAFDRADVMAGQDLATVEKGPDFLLHVLLDAVVDGKLAPLEALEDDIDAAEEGMLRDVSSFRLEDMVRLRRALLTLRKSLFHEREVLVKICRRDSPFVSEAAIYHFRDVYDHLAKFFELTESSRDMVTSLMEMYLSMLNNRMTKAANDTNIIVRRLTFITTIFMPLSLLAGIGGMSEWSMMTGPSNWRIAYPAFLALMVVLGVANYYLLKRLEKRQGRRTRQDQRSAKSGVV